jgi:hypothetical protein
MVRLWYVPDATLDWQVEVIGYPPADAAIKSYFFTLLPADPETYAKHYTAFFISLFKELANLITAEGWTEPSGLRDWLAVGGDYKMPGPNRSKFYLKVTEQARKVSVHSTLGTFVSILLQIFSNLSPPQTPTMKAPESFSTRSPSHVFRVRQSSPVAVPHAESSSSAQLRFAEDSRDTDRPLSTPGVLAKLPLEQAALDLLELIKVEKGSPLQLLISLDEAELLAELVDGVSWSRLSSLQRVLRQLRDLNIFTCALATTGKIQQFTPSRDSVNSARLQKGVLEFFPPFAALGFDQLARTRAAGKTVFTLAKVTDLEFMVAFGRPL